MRIIILAFFLVFSTLSLRAEPIDEIKGTITAQLEALKVDDFATAFTYASPSIRYMFGTPENFSTMVRNGYPMVWRYEDFTFLDHEITVNGQSQDVRIKDLENRLHYLRYHMVETANGWKISGVVFLNPADFSV